MKSIESNVALKERPDATHADREASPQRFEAAYEEKQVAEKPKASEEIMIEEISIDGMCGVY